MGFWDRFTKKNDRPEQATRQSQKADVKAEISKSEAAPSAVEEKKKNSGKSREIDQLRRWGESRETEDGEKKLRLLTQLVREGYPAAMYDLGTLYRYGQCVDSYDWEKARELFLQCYEEIPYAALSLAQMDFRTAWKVEREDQLDEGIRFFAIAAGKGMEEAFPEIHKYWHKLDNSEENWIAESFKEELKPILTELQSRDDESALDTLGLFYLHGIYYEQDLAKAKELFERSAAFHPEDVHSSAANHLKNPLFAMLDEDDEE